MARPMELNSKKIMIGAAIALLLTISLIVALIFYSRDAPATSQFSITAAIIALVGTLWTGAITLAGLLLKDSVDRRNALFQEESEKRLRMETALKAVELMSTAEVEGVPVRESREAAILVISSLNQLRLALSMADQFLTRDKVSPEALVGVVEQCLDSDDTVLKGEAAYALRLNAGRLVVGPTLLSFPGRHMIAWTGTLPYGVKESLLLALLTAVLSKDHKFWHDNVLNWALYALYKIFTVEKERRFKYVAAVFANELCDLMERQPGEGMMPGDRHFLSYDQIRQEAIAVMKPFGPEEGNIGADDYELLVKIRDWKKPPVKA